MLHLEVKKNTGPCHWFSMMPEALNQTFENDTAHPPRRVLTARNRRWEDEHVQWNQ